MIYKDTDKRQDYCPPILANGDISLAIGAEGAPTEAEAVKLSPSPYIFRAGRRGVINPSKNDRAALFTFGSFSIDVGEKPRHFEQELVLPDAYVRSVCEYANGKVITKCFVHENYPLYALQKEFFFDGEVSFIFDYSSGESRKNALDNCKIILDSDGARFTFFADGQEDYKGELRIFLDRECKTSLENGSVVLKTNVKNGDKLAFYICLEDDLFGIDPAKANDALHNNVKKLGFEGMLAQSAKAWREYFSIGYVKTDNEKLNSVYMTALYHLKCFTTRWSIPVGLYDRCWAARYFAFDEYYGFFGLLGTGHVSLAKRVPTFRLECCLDRAIARATSVRSKDKQARFMWESLENGCEGAPLGHWLDHVFQMCVIALGAYEYYEYTCDKNFLARCYEMIRTSAKFFTLNMIYYDGGKPYIGKCTDLERLGDSHERAFVTTCGAIRLLELCAKASEILDTDADYRKECRVLAKGLYESLPDDGEKYLPYPEADVRSIGVFSGKFPFDVLEPSDKKMLRAFDDYIENEKIFGNMYHMGTGVSSWYASWKAAAYARCSMADKATASLNQAVESVGAFDEFFEINEDEVRMHPWFMTSAGVFLSALNEMLLRSDGEHIELLPAFAEKNVSFKLLAKGGVTVEAVIEDGNVKKLKLSSPSCDSLPEVYYKGSRIFELNDSY